MPDILGLGVISLAVWRISSLLVRESGPWAILVRLRTFVGVVHDDNDEPVGWSDGQISALFSCVWCMSLWLAVPIYFLYEYVPLAVWLIALSGGAIIIDAIVRGKA